MCVWSLRRGRPHEAAAIALDEQYLTMKTFFTTLYQHSEGKIEIRTLPNRHQAYFEKSDHAGIARHIERCSNTNVFFGVATRDGKGGKKDNIVHISAVWIDVDSKDITKEQFGENLKRFQFKPSITILSGGGAHLYWLLNEPAEKSDIETVEDVNRRIAHALGGDQSATEAARVLRVPGTLNHKYSPPRPVKLHRIEKFEYSLDDFSDLPNPPATSQASNKPLVTLKPVKHGKRNTTLARIAGKYIRLGWTSQEVLDLCLGWNVRCNPPQPIDDVVKTVNSIVAIHKRRNKQGNPRNGTKKKRFRILN